MGQVFITKLTLIFEVVSHSNARLDTVTKMDFYEKHEIEEYNLVYQEGKIHEYKLNEYGVYYLNKSYKKDDVYKSIALENLEIDINNVFKGYH